jgi:hypothetical protein
MFGGVGPAHAQITLVSNDNRQFVISQAVAYMSDMLRYMEVDGTDDVPLMNVDGDTLEKVLEYCQFHAHPSHGNYDANILDFDEDYLQRLNDDDLFQLLAAALFLDIKPLLHLLSKKVACRVVTEWHDTDAVKQAFAIDGAFTAHEHDEIVQTTDFVRTSLEKAFEIVDHYTQQQCTRNVLLKLSTRVDMERLLLLEYSLVVPMALERIGYLHSTVSTTNVLPITGMASRFSRLPLLVMGFVCGHFTEPFPELLDIIRGRENKFDGLLRNLEELGLMVPYDRESCELGNGFLKGPSRMHRHDYDPESGDDDELDEHFKVTLKPAFDPKYGCKGQSCGDIIDDNGQARIVAAYSGWNKAGSRYERALLEGETHDDAKNSLCQMKGCLRCDMAINRCVSKTHDIKGSRRDIWIPFLHSHLSQFTPRHLHTTRTPTRPNEPVTGGTRRR